jgi:DNA-binding transcriptional LysR family regulator
VELRHLRYFVAVAEELHFGHAASRLNTFWPRPNAPPVSQGRRRGARLTSLSSGSPLIPTGCFLGKTLRLFAEHVPFVDVLFQNLTPEAQVDALRGGGIDVGFVGLPLEAEGLVTETTGRARFVVALPAKHPMARSVPLR